MRDACFGSSGFRKMRPKIRVLHRVFPRPIHRTFFRFGLIHPQRKCRGDVAILRHRQAPKDAEVNETDREIGGVGAMLPTGWARSWTPQKVQWRSSCVRIFFLVEHARLCLRRGYFAKVFSVLIFAGRSRPIRIARPDFAAVSIFRQFQPF